MTAKAPGTATITATAEGDSKVGPTEWLEHLEISEK